MLNESVLENKKYLVVGLGTTGISLADFLLSQGVEVGLSDSSDNLTMTEDIRRFSSKGVRMELGKHTEEMFLWADTIVLSPGVPFNLPLIKNAIDNGKEVISEIELAHKFISKPIIAVTGSNGKTTTTSLINDILQASGYNVFMGGNIGTPLIKIAGKDDVYDFILLELSSFQLQGIKLFKPFISVCLNIYPNHLDHHADLNEYVNSKMNIFINQTSHDWAVINNTDTMTLNNLDKIRAKLLRFGYDPGCNAWAEQNLVRTADNHYELKGMRLVGRHNIENVMAAILVCTTLNCDMAVIKDTIMKFESLPHRIEFVGKYKDASIYNDSKSTTPHATLKALQAFESPVILIAGGKDKGLDYSVFKSEVTKKVKSLILLGESSSKIKSIYEGYVPVTVVETLNNAVSKALSEIDDSETVLFSPACSSFDMFKSYEERGRVFKEIVQNIKH